MNVVYDHQIFCLQEYGGISRYFYELAKRVGVFEGYDVSIVAPLHVNEYLRSTDSVKVLGRYLPRIPRTGRVRQRLNAGLTSLLLHKTRPDIVHETYYWKKKLAPKTALTVVTVFDMIHEKFSRFFRSSDRTGEMKAQAVRRADHVICISENTKNDVVELLKVDQRKITVVYLGYALSRSNTLDNRLMQEPYVLYVGLRDGYKNFSGLLRAYGSSQSLKANSKLVCFGGKPFSGSELQTMRQEDVPEGNVVQISGDDDILANLYSHALIYVCPSLYEGFGMPPLEAMSFRCPVACSDTGSLREICRDAAAYFDPYNPDSIRSTIENALESQEVLDLLIKRGLERIKHFSWEACAQKTSAVYCSLL